MQIRFCYDGDKPVQPNVAAGQDPAPAGTGRICPVVRLSLAPHCRHETDAQQIHRARSTIDLDRLDQHDRRRVYLDGKQYPRDRFVRPGRLLRARISNNSGKKKTSITPARFTPCPVPLTFSGQSAEARVMFSPGCGLEIDSEIARRVRAAKRRVRICSLLINSGTLISELGNLLRARPRRRWMEFTIAPKWRRFTSSGRKCRQIVGRSARSGNRRARRVWSEKTQRPTARPGATISCTTKFSSIDDTVITGSYNFSRSAQFNAENILFIESAPLAEAYTDYIDHLIAKYRH